MNPALNRFLATEELDALGPARAEILALGGDDSHELLSILTRWSDRQAIANLLMHPDLIPNEMRPGYLLRGLRETAVPYYALAAAVGLQRLEGEGFTDEAKSQIVDELLRLMDSENEAIAGRASIAVADYLQLADTPKVVEKLNHPSRLIRHNSLVALIQLVKLATIREVLQTVLASGQLSPQAETFIQQNLAQLNAMAEAGQINKDKFLASPLSAPLLIYIPNLT